MRTVKSGIGIVAAAALTMAIVISCASSPHVNTSQIPRWYLNPPHSKTMFYGVGSAKESSLELSRSLAIASARQELAGSVQTVVKSGITRYLQQAGSGGSQQAVNFGDNVTRQISKVALNGSTVEKVAVASDGTVYALVSYPESQMNASAKEAFARNNAAAFAQFQADQAVKALDNELANSPPPAKK